MEISARKRLEYLVDRNSFEETNEKMEFKNIIGFPGYCEKHRRSQQLTRLDEAIITGIAEVNGKKFALGFMEKDFIMGSMGVILGEKVARLFELGIKERCPVAVFTASGGARMQEGIAALFQMSKTAMMVGKMNEHGIPLICVLTNPTTGGVSASFAMLGDVILAEPDALIGFAGPRVIKQTIRQDLPEGFQKTEHLLKCGFVDGVIHRDELRKTLSFLADIYYRSAAGKLGLVRVIKNDTRENKAI